MQADIEKKKLQSATEENNLENEERQWNVISEKEKCDREFKI